MQVNWGHGLTFAVGLIIGIILGVLFFADDAEAAAGLIRLTLGG